MSVAEEREILFVVIDYNPLLRWRKSLQKAKKKKFFLYNYLLHRPIYCELRMQKKKKQWNPETKINTSETHQLNQLNQ